MLMQLYVKDEWIGIGFKDSLEDAYDTIREMDELGGDLAMVYRVVEGKQAMVLGEGLDELQTAYLKGLLIGILLYKD